MLGFKPFKVCVSHSELLRQLQLAQRAGLGGQPSRANLPGHYSCYYGYGKHAGTDMS